MSSGSEAEAMPINRWIAAIGVLGLLSLTILRLLRSTSPQLQGRIAPPRLISQTPPTPSGRALRRSRQLWEQAKAEELQERERLEAWEPRAPGGQGWDAWRLARMAEDRSGLLGQARAAAQQAATLARAPEE